MESTLLLTFSDRDTDVAVRRDALAELAKSLGLTETETVHVAIRILRDVQIVLDYGDYPPLTDEQMEWIRKEAEKYTGPGPHTWTKRLFDDLPPSDED